MAKRIRPREAILQMAPYHPPTGGRADKLRLDFNENTIGCSPKVIEFLKQRLDENRLAVYPEYTEAKRDLAAHFKVSESEMLLTNGTDEAIQVLINTFIDDEDEVIILRPSYAMYKFYTEVAGGTVRELDYRAESLAFPLEELLEAIQPTTRAVLISNPNNPTGTSVKIDGIERILKRAANAAVLIDEAYYEFCGITALAPHRRVSESIRQPHILEGLTEWPACALAAYSRSRETSKCMHKCQSPYSVNTLAALAARVAVQDSAFISRYVTEVLAARELVFVGLEKLSIPYYDSDGNFVLMRLGPRAIEVRDKLREAGVLVRDRSYEIAGCVRVTIGTRDQMRRFLSELERIWKA